MNDTLQRLQRAIDFVEEHLFDDLPLATIARSAAFSPWHFHRLFVAVAGETPAVYVRKRRHAEVCRQLCETEQPIATLALDCGFESQATFTRAFTQQIGVSPGRYRRARVIAPAHRYPPLDAGALAARQRRKCMQPKIVRKPAFHIVGMSGRFTPATNSRIPELWSRFAPRMEHVPHRRGWTTFGLCMDADPDTVEEVGFTYVAAVEVERIEDVPEGMIALTIPERTYAVFTHSGHIARLADTVRQVWGRWLPASGCRHVAAPDFELYDERFDPETGNGEVDIYVPIASE